MHLHLDAISVRIDGAPVVTGIELHCEPGEFVGLLGPNGSGKSTALKTVYCAVRPTSGCVRLDGSELPRRPAARAIAAMGQDNSGEFPFTVEEVVSTGRIPHQGTFRGTTDADRRAVAGALDAVGLGGHGTRAYGPLSGGEKQRVLLARALAQQPHVLVLDEPTNHLDIATQLDLLTLVGSLGITVLAALHDLNLAAAYCDRIYVLRDGAIVAGGRTADVLTPQLIAEVFGVHAHPSCHPVTGRQHFMFSPFLEGPL